MKRGIATKRFKTFCTIFATRLVTVAFTFSLLGFSANFANAEVIEVPIGQQASDKQTIKRPSMGLKTSEVEAEFGAPINKTSAVGDPPISTWIYPDFVVYFEYDHVIHSVLKHTPIATE